MIRLDELTRTSNKQMYFQCKTSRFSTKRKMLFRLSQPIILLSTKNPKGGLRG